MIRVPPPIWMFLFLALGGIASAAYPWKQIADWQILPLGIVLVVLALSPAVSAFLLFRKEGTEIRPDSEANRSLVVRGPYRFTRNPMYLGLVTLSIGIAFCVGSLPMFAVPVLVFAVANSVHIPFEEAKMRRQFGQAYENYTARVRRWI